ncbi:MAG: response regulator [Thermoanaerobaculia bacterium]
MSGNVLIVDDDEQVREYLTRTLEREGCTVVAARDGMEALEMIRETPFQAIVLDLVMPRVDGFGVIHYLREHMPSLLRSVIILTAVSVPQLYSQPVRRIVTKPFEVSEIAKYVRECCDSRSLA